MRILQGFGSNLALVMAAVMVFVSFATSALAATVTWNGGTSASWSDAGNWDAAPADNDSLFFSGTANQANTNDAGITNISSLALSNPGWNINLGGADVTITNINATGSSELNGNIRMADGDRIITLNGIGSTLTLDGTLKLYRTANQIQYLYGAGNVLEIGGLDIGGNYTRTIAGSSSVNVNGDVSGGNSTKTFTWSSSGTLILKGTNTYPSQTVISAGTLDLGGGTASGSIASTALTLGNAVFNYTRTGDSTQSFTTTTLSGGARIHVAAGNTLNLGTLTKSTRGAVEFGTTGTITTTRSNVNGILGGWASIGGNWAVANGGSSPITGYTGSYSLTSVALDDPANYTNQMIGVDSSQAPSGVITPYTLTFNTAGAYTLTLTAGNNDILSDGIMVSSTVGDNPAVITNGTLRCSSNGSLNIIQNNTANRLTISSVIANNGTSGLVKSGSGTLILTGASTYTGATVIHGGTLQLGDGGTNGALSTASAIVNNGNLSIYRTNAIVQGTAPSFANIITGTGSISYTGPLNDINNKLTLGTNTHTGGFIINSGTIAGIVTGIYAGFGTGTLTIKGDTIFDGAGAYVATFQNNVDWDAGLIRMRRSSSGAPIVTWNGNITLKHNATLTHFQNTYSFNHIFNGNIGEDVAGRTLSFTGGNTGTRPIYTLNGQNTYSGSTTVGNGSLVIGGSGYLGGGNYAAAVTVNQALTYSSSADQVFSGAITAFNLIKDTASSTLTLASATGNTFSGTNTVSAGTLLVNNTSGSGTGTNAVTVNGGTLGGTGTIGGNVTVGAAGSVAPGAAGAGTLTIGGNLYISAMAGGAGKLVFELAAVSGTNDHIAVTGTLTIGAGILGFSDFEFPDTGMEEGTYTLISSGGINPGDSLDGADLQGDIGRLQGVLKISGNDLQLAVKGSRGTVLFVR